MIIIIIIITFDYCENGILPNGYKKRPQTLALQLAEQKENTKLNLILS